MQYKDDKTLLLAKVIGETIKELRLKNGSTINQFAHEFDLDVGNTSRIENGAIDIKTVTLWKISEALNIKPSRLLKFVEKKLGEEFHFFDI